MILEQIARDTEIRVTQQKKKVPLGTLKKAAYQMETDTGFPFEKALAKEGLSFICEVKKPPLQKGSLQKIFRIWISQRNTKRRGQMLSPV